MEWGHRMSQDQARSSISEQSQNAFIDASISRKTIDPTWHMPKDARSEQPNGFQRGLAWVVKRLTFTVMLLSMLTGLLFATSHLLFLEWLDGTKTEGRSIRQSHVTAISLLIVTGFKASITLAVGIAFSQHMWLIFRRRTFAIRHIEQLFNLRSNLIHVSKIQNSPGAPILFAMAVFVWVLPVATVYPPSALTVSFLRYMQTEMRNVPILDPPQTKFDPWNVTSDIHSMLGDFESNIDNTSNMAWETFYLKPKRSLRSLASLVLLSGKISDFPSPGSANSSYTTIIPSPQVSCGEPYIDYAYKDVIVSEDIPFYHFGARWAGVLMLAAAEKMQAVRVPDQKGLHGETYWKVSINATRWSCQPTLAQLVLNISYVEGTRHITYVTKNVQKFEPQLRFQFESNQTRVNSSEFDRWTAEVKEGARISNIWAVLDAALGAFQFECSGNAFVDPTKDGDIQFFEGCFEKELPFTDIFFSDQQRRNDTYIDGRAKISPKEINITEAAINEYLIKMAISALSLDVGKAPVPVNITTYQATYEFSNPLNLILPYSLSLLFCVVFVVIGIWSWTHNGASAADGGFLQVMTATTGRTRMEELVVAQHIDKDNLPEELLDLEIRYGELLDAEGVGTGVAGFGTVEETQLLRKGWRSG